MHFGGRDSQKRLFIKVKRIATVTLAALACICAVCAIFGGIKINGEEKISYGFSALWIQKTMAQMYAPIFSFLEEDSISETPMDFLYDGLLSQLPFYYYNEKNTGFFVSKEDMETYDKLLRQEGMDEDKKDIGENSLEYEKDALHIDGDLEKAMRDENSRLTNQAQEQEEEPIKEEKIEGFIKATTKTYAYNFDEINEFDDIVSAFYAIDKTTSITDKQLNLETLLSKDMTIKGDGDKPQILIYHTHSQEDFVDSIRGDESTTIVGAGERLAQLLEDEYGFNVMHHKGRYDVEARDYAYSNSLPAIEKILAENPSIEVVIDLHRDAVKEGRKLMVDLQGKPTAQFMFFNGLSRTRQNGDISYLDNPYVDDNLAFSFQAQVACNEYYPGLARRIYLKAYRYNMHLRGKSMLVELGAQTNTVEEIKNACEPLAHVISMVLDQKKVSQE